MRIAQQLGINQENVSRIEKRSDLLLSTLSGYVEAMGGKLSLVVEFPRPSADCADRHCNAGQGNPSSKAIILLCQAARKFSRSDLHRPLPPSQPSTQPSQPPRRRFPSSPVTKGCSPLAKHLTTCLSWSANMSLSG